MPSQKSTINSFILTLLIYKRISFLYYRTRHCDASPTADAQHNPMRPKKKNVQANSMSKMNVWKSLNYIAHYKSNKLTQTLRIHRFCTIKAHKNSRSILYVFTILFKDGFFFSLSLLLFHSSILKQTRRN